MIFTTLVLQYCNIISYTELIARHQVKFNCLPSVSLLVDAM